MKIAFLIPGFGGGGAEKQCIYLINELQKNAALNIHLIHFHKGVNYDLLSMDKISVHELKSGSMYSPALLKKVLNEISHIKPDIIFSWLHSCDIFSYIIKKRFPSVKWIMSERNSAYPREAKFIVRNMLGRYADMIVANSEKGKRYWSDRGLQGSKISVAKNIVHADESSIEISESLFPVITYAGRLEPQKNVINLAHAFCKIADDFPKGRMYIIGEGQLKDTVTEIVKDKSNIEVKPFQKNIRAYFNVTNVFVSISHHEGLPNTLIENIMSDNTIVASNIQEHRELLGDDYPFLISNYNNVDDIVCTVKSALNKNKDNSLLEHARVEVDNMKAEKVAGFYTELFSRVINK